MNYKVKSAKILYNEEGNPKGAGFVYLESQSDAMAAVEESKKTQLNVDGNRVFVQVSRQ